MSGFGPLRQFDFNHFDIGQGRFLSKCLIRKVPVFIPAAKVAGADIPDQIAAKFQMIAADSALSRVMSKTTCLGTAIECTDGVGR